MVPRVGVRGRRLVRNRGTPIPRLTPAASREIASQRPSSSSGRASSRRPTAVTQSISAAGMKDLLQRPYLRR